LLELFLASHVAAKNNNNMSKLYHVTHRVCCSERVH
jgi:hypothetical protein